MRHISSFPLPAPILSLLESLRCGGFLLDLRGRVLSLNMLAVGCLGDGLVLGGDRLSAIDRNADLRLQRLVGTALGTAGVPVPQSIAVRRAGRLPLMIRTLPLQEQGAMVEQGR